MTDMFGHYGSALVGKQYKLIFEGSKKGPMKSYGSFQNEELCM